MSIRKASAALQLVPPPPPTAAQRRSVRMGKVHVGRLYVPGTVVRLPAHGLFYEVAPKDHGRSADWLQALLLIDKGPHQVVIPCNTTERRLRTVVECIDRAWFAFAGLFGVTR